jgi:anti-sigma regulatory factor (Ser/Thr protein kinase)
MTDIDTSAKANYRFKLVAAPDAPHLARTLVSSVLIYWRLGHLIEDGKLVVSELVSNAIAAAPGREVRLGVDREQRAVRIGVQDVSDEEPVAGSPELMDTSGRGLFIVAALATDHGWHRVEAGGKVVWARLPT